MEHYRGTSGRGALFRGARFRGGSSRGRGFSRSSGGGYSSGVPEAVIEVGRVLHVCEDQLVCECALTDQVPYFNGRIFLENKEEIGKIDEILGPIHKSMFSVKMGNHLKASSFKKDSSLFIDANQVLPLSRFLPKPPTDASVSKKSKGIAKPSSRPASRGRGGLVRGRGTLRRGTPRTRPFSRR